MSTWKTVVTCGAVRSRLSTMCAAIRRRMGVCGTRCTPSSIDSGMTEAATGAAPPGAAASTSSTVMRPPSPLPWIVSALRPRSASRRRTAGLSGPAACDAPGDRRAGFAATLAAATGARVAGGVSAAGVPACRRASSAPGATSVPSGATISASTPSAGAGTSTVTLSVSISTSGSSRLAASPTAFSQRWTCDRVPSTWSAGSTTSMRPLIG